MPRVVLDPLAEPQLVEHFQVETGTLFNPLQLDQLIVLLKKFHTLAQFGLDGFDGAQRGAAGGHIMAGGIDGIARDFSQGAASERIEQRHAFDFVVEQRYAHGGFRAFRRKNIQHVSPHPERATRKFEFVAFILHFCQALNGFALGNFFVFAQMQDHAVIVHRVAYPVYA